MRGVFDEDEIEPARQKTDTELTLGSGTLLAIFFGLVLLCGLCFGMGYTVGHRGSGPTAITSPQPATEQEPLQPNAAIPKPSAMTQTPVAPPADSAADQAPVNGSGQSTVPAAQATSATLEAQQVHPALPAGGATEAVSSAQDIRPALVQQPAAQSIMVQVAAVSNAEDAEVLVNALRQRNYPVTARRDPGDSYIHVRVGPFATRVLAEQWKTRLLNDGYNAVVQP